MTRIVASKALEYVPQSEENANQRLAEIGELKRKIQLIETQTAAQIETIKAEAREQIKPFEDGMNLRLDGLVAFAQARREQLTHGGKRKSIHYPSGDMGWRFTAPAVIIRDVEQVLAQLKAEGLRRFIRIKEEIDRNALLRERDIAEKVEGIQIKRREEFFVKPADLDLEITRRV